MDEIDDIKIDLAKKIGEPIGLAYRLNVSLINILWTIVSGRRLHAQQQEFQSVYECIDKITGFMSRAAIMSFLPFLSKIVPESISKMERGRYYRNRFVAISEKWIREHKEDYRGNRTGDLQDAYLEKIKEGCDGFSETDLSALLRELFVIGAESESVMLRYQYNGIIIIKPKIIYIYLSFLSIALQFIRILLNLFGNFLDGLSAFCQLTKMHKGKCKMKLIELLEKEM